MSHKDQSYKGKRNGEAIIRGFWILAMKNERIRRGAVLWYWLNRDNGDCSLTVIK